MPCIGIGIPPVFELPAGPSSGAAFTVLCSMGIPTAFLSCAGFLTAGFFLGAGLAGIGIDMPGMDCPSAGEVSADVPSTEQIRNRRGFSGPSLMKRTLDGGPRVHRQI